MKKDFKAKSDELNPDITLTTGDAVDEADIVLRDTVVSPVENLVAPVENLGEPVENGGSTVEPARPDRTASEQLGGKCFDQPALFNYSSKSLEHMSKFGFKLFGHVLDYNEQSAVGMSVAMTPMLGFASIVVFGKIISTILDHTFHYGDLRSSMYVLGPMILMVGMVLPCLSLLGRKLAHHGWYRCGEFLFTSAYLPCKFLPYGMLGFSLAERFLCEFNLSLGRLNQAYKYARRLKNRPKTPETAALVSALLVQSKSHEENIADVENAANETMQAYLNLAADKDVKDRLGRELYNHVGQAYFAA